MERFDTIPGDAVAMSVITQGELMAGLVRKPLATQLNARFAILSATVPAVDLPAAAAAHYAAIRAHLEQKGAMIGSNDLWIAAHALAAGMTLVTNNVREFKRVPKLKLENWTAA
jgi:tRNA(fMet)-specific endonuclease VapC